VPALAARLGEEQDSTVRDELLTILADFGPDAAEAVEAVTAALDDDLPRIRYTAAFTLGNIGPKAKSAIPALKKNIRNPDSFLKLVSAWALVQISPGDLDIGILAAPLLRKGLTHAKPRVRLECVKALGMTGRKGPLVIRALRTASKDSDAEVRKAASELLKKLTE
jgi:HEAT repeat protein